jgi:hypothetical protein
MSILATELERNCSDEEYTNYTGVYLKNLPNWKVLGKIWITENKQQLKELYIRDIQNDDDEALDNEFNEWAYVRWFIYNHNLDTVLYEEKVNQAIADLTA